MHALPWMRRVATTAIVLTMAAPAAALIGSGDSAVGTIETMPPTVGTLTVAPTSTTAPIPVGYSGVADADSGVASVELYFRSDALAWQTSGETSTGAGGSIDFTPPGIEPGNHGIYMLQLVATDTLGNSSAVPSGFAGSGQASTTFGAAASVADWWLFE